MKNSTIENPRVVSRDKWLAARKQHLSKEKELTRLRDQLGWTFPWVSSYGSDFNYDFHITLDEAKGPVEYNFMDKSELEQKDEPCFLEGEQPGLSVFLRESDSIFHTYSTYARGGELLLGTFNYLDLTPLGRQEDEGIMSWVRLHDNYSDDSNSSESL